MPLIWREDPNSKFWTLAQLTNYLDLCERGLKLNLCVPAPRPFPSSTVEIETEGEPADFFFAGLAFVVSGSLRELLKTFGVQSEFFKVTVRHRGRLYHQKKYYFVNILESVACFDYKKSRYKQTPTGVTGISKLALDDAKAKGHHLFQVGPIGWAAPPNPRAVRIPIRCASEELAEQIEALGLTGVLFCRPADWRIYPPRPWKA